MEEIDFEISHFHNFGPLWPRHSIGSYGILSCSTHQPLSPNQISFKWETLWTDRRTDIRITDRRTYRQMYAETGFTRPTQKIWPKNLPSYDRSSAASWRRFCVHRCPVHCKRWWTASDVWCTVINIFVLCNVTWDVTDFRRHSTSLPAWTVRLNTNTPSTATHYISNSPITLLPWKMFY